jgi:hypothetical protein
MSRLLRILKVTAALAGIGAVVGGLVGVVIAVLIGVSQGNFAWAYLASVFACMIGAVAGVILGPTAAWLLMRRVTIWKAVVGTAVGAALGFFGGLLFLVLYHRSDGLWPFYGSVLGFLLAALTLRLTSHSSAETVPEGAR